MVYTIHLIWILTIRSYASQVQIFIIQRFTPNTKVVDAIARVIVSTRNVLRLMHSYILIYKLFYDKFYFIYIEQKYLFLINYYFLVSRIFKYLIPYRGV